MRRHGHDGARRADFARHALQLDPVLSPTFGLGPRRPSQARCRPTPSASSGCQGDGSTLHVFVDAGRPCGRTRLLGALDANREVAIRSSIASLHPPLAFEAAASNSASYPPRSRALTRIGRVRRVVDQEEPRRRRRRDCGRGGPCRRRGRTPDPVRTASGARAVVELVLDLARRGRSRDGRPCTTPRARRPASYSTIAQRWPSAEAAREWMSGWSSAQSIESKSSLPPALMAAILPDSSTRRSRYSTW